MSDLELLPLAEELNEYTVTPGVLGFIVFAVLGVGVWLLLKSMSRHLRKVAIQEGTEAEDRARDGLATAGPEREAGASRP
ncbi:hypothetical protein RM780_25815 [Streptomyces sp. DSM 44917]|uniref:Uncharacterized protein n=1 Tax=Streptomyces boetiae TaxID=3075541 RepID=A0ABU2LFH1_9ACTN|nr:hypothetical protein [Streptomyces sp. DSM 44917]MDT0310339.1 hypothetical protein [Streptomyces sp. DSM 44917]